ncbi:MAG TPA: carboxypeptidase regulatory-like domain-containing protein [Blastocatellia bacterium]|nr:carboxypeptidase regulatory-like domain-containing protein [Blastocatellia bacterium]
MSCHEQTDRSRILAALRRAINSLPLLILISISTLAQTETGQISGRVTDESGAVIPGAAVTVKSIELLSERKSTTNREGLYVLPNLQPGFYDVTFTAGGFASHTERLQVTVGSHNSLNILLQAGSATPQPEEKKSNIKLIPLPQLKVEDTSQTVSTVITEKQLRDLPSLTRNPYDFAILSGNVSPGDSTRRGVGLAINGQRASSVNFLMDGAVNNNQYSAQVGQRVPLESVQEFRVIAGGLSAEYGRAAGGVINVVTKSGTNQFHGSGFEFYRGSGLSSNNFDNNANNLDKGDFTRHQYGWSISGPAIKDKLYFFNATEWTRVRSVNTVINIVPSSALIDNSSEATRNYFGRFSRTTELPADNDENASKLYEKSEILSRFGTRTVNPDGTISNPNGIIAGQEFSRIPSDRIVFGQVENQQAIDAGGGDPQDDFQSVIRMDYNFSSKETVAFRLGTDRQTLFDGTTSFSPWNGFNTGSRLQNDNLSLSMTQAHSARLITQTRFAVNRLSLRQPLGTAGSVPGLYFFANAPLTIDGYEVVLPGYSNYGRTVLPFGGPQNVYQFYQDGTYLWRKHDFRFGGQYNYTQDNRTYGAGQNAVQVLDGGSSVGQALDNLISGDLYSFTAAIDPQGRFPGQSLTYDTDTNPIYAPNFTRSNRYHEAAAYLNDSWRVRRNVTLNLGMRYEFFSVPHNKDRNFDSNFYLGDGASLFEQIRNGQVGLTSGSAANGFYKSDKNNLAPRVGFAWDLFGDGRTSLRGGYGVAFDRVFDNAIVNIMKNPPKYAEVGLAVGTNISGLDITDSNTGPFEDNGTLTIPQSNITAIDANLTTASAQFWNVSLQRELARNLVVSIDYSASRGRNLYAISNLNRIGSGNVYLGDGCTTNCTSRLNNQYADINMLTNQGRSNYQGVTFGIDSRNFLSRGLLFNARYTWATAKDNISSTLSEGLNNFNFGFLDPFNPDLDYGYADYDIRHRFVLSGVWDLPYQPNFKPSTISGYIFKYMLRGMSLSGMLTAQSGTPFSVYDCSNSINGICMRAVGSADSNGSSNPADVGTPNRFSYIDLSGLSSGSYLNPITGTSIFGPFPSGMTARNSFRGPGNWNLDLGLFKTLSVREWGTLQLRGEVYNVFNHANLFVIGSETDISRNSYVPAKRDGRRNVQLALRFSF